jgi:hypothetical protein
MAAISADHQLPVDGTGGRVHSGNATVLGDQTGDTQSGADIGARCSRSVDEQRIERDPPNAQAGMCAVRFIEHGLDADGVIDHHRHVIELNRSGRQDRVEDAKLVQQLHSARLDQMSRRGFRRKLGTVNQADAQTPPREHQCQRGSSAPSTNNHHIESLHTAPVIARRLASPRP